jgi:hypothetical protein
MTTTRRPEDTVSPARNFALSADERVRAYMSGAPAYALRRRRIEDLQAQLAKMLREPGDLQPTELRARLAQGLERLNMLIDKHNRYYPIECNLPIDVATGQLLDMGEPWRPLPPVTLESL